MEGYELSLEEAKEMYIKTRDRIKSIEEKAYSRLFPGYVELKKAEKSLKEQGKEASDDDIAKNLGWPLEQVTFLKNKIEDFKRRSDSTTNPLELQNLVNGMSPEFQKEFREIFKD